MEVPKVRLRRATAICLAALLTAQFGAISASAQQQTAPVQAPATQAPDTTNTPVPSQSAPAQPAPSTDASPASPAVTTQQPAAPAQQQQQTTPPPPVGTAAAPYEKGVGVAASRPAGVVIAPAKQRRARSFLIKVGLIVGAAAAVGTVVALSNASPSRQPK